MLTSHVQPRLKSMDDLIGTCNVFQLIHLLLLTSLWTVHWWASRLLAELPQWLPPMATEVSG
jgi:hypothetical protein